MAKVKFVKDAFVSGELFAKKGDIKDIEPSSSVNRWLKRGHELVGEENKVLVSEPDLKPIEDFPSVDFDAMDKDALISFAEENEIEIDKRLGVKKIKDKIQEWLEENSEDVEDSF